MIRAQTPEKLSQFSAAEQIPFSCQTPWRQIKRSFWAVPLHANLPDPSQAHPSAVPGQFEPPAPEAPLVPRQSLPVPARPAPASPSPPLAPLPPKPGFPPRPPLSFPPRFPAPPTLPPPNAPPFPAAADDAPAAASEPAAPPQYSKQGAEGECGEPLQAASAAIS